jgi:membrane fusion protein (multidrug efflux system)
VAVTDGVISQVASLNVGQFVAAGTTIASLVETKASWVEANFKETQLAGIRVGMKAEVAVDAIPGKPIEGTVTSIGAATGSEFSLIPAQNATGNWVKVTQRIPVRIDFGDAVPADLLRSGMSAVVSVDTGANTLERMTGEAKPL